LFVFTLVLVQLKAIAIDTNEHKASR